MVRPASDPGGWRTSLERASDSGRTEDLGAWLRAHPAHAESDLADLIDADSRFRVEVGLPTPLGRYLEAAPEIERMPVALDAAIEAALRWMCSSGRAEEEAVAALVDSYPRLSGAIVDAVTLNRGVWSTRWLIDRLGPPVARDLPCDAGPTMEDGRRRYRLVEVLGRGSCGEVYLGIDRRLSDGAHEATVALKMLDARGAGEDARRRFMNEAMRARRVDHPSVVRVLDRGEMEGGVLFIVYECVRGRTLARWVRERGGRVPAREAAALVASVARGVHAAHASGLIHCDLHPTNVLIDEGGRPRICDFGIAVLRDELGEGEALGLWGGRALGSLAFIPPEQYGLEERALGTAADVYALGGLLHFLLTGDLPNGSSAAEIQGLLGRGQGAAARIRERPGGPLDRDLSAIRLRALASDPAARHASASALADDLESWQARLPIEWTGPSPARRARLFVRRRPLASLMGGVALAALVAGASAMSYTFGVVHSRRQGMMRWYEGYQARRDRIMTQSDGASVVLPLWILDKFKLDEALGGDGMVPEIASREQLGVVGTMVGQGLAEPGGPDPIVLLLETTQAILMLVDRERHPEVREVIARNRSAWSELLPPESRFLRELEVLDAVAIVKGELADAVAGAPFDEPSLRHAEATLLAALPMFDTWYKGSDVHLLVVRALRGLYGKYLLDEPAGVAEYRALYESLRPEWLRTSATRTTRGQAPPAGRS